MLQRPVLDFLLLAAYYFLLLAAYCFLLLAAYCLPLELIYACKFTEYSIECSDDDDDHWITS
jgi:hypothetical protein